MKTLSVSDGTLSSEKINDQICSIGGDTFDIVLGKNLNESTHSNREEKKCIPICLSTSTMVSEKKLFSRYQCGIQTL